MNPEPKFPFAQLIQCHAEDRGGPFPHDRIKLERLGDGNNRYLHYPNYNDR